MENMPTGFSSQSFNGLKINFVSACRSIKVHMPGRASLNSRAEFTESERKHPSGARQIACNIKIEQYKDALPRSPCVNSCLN